MKLIQILQSLTQWLVNIPCGEPMCCAVRLTLFLPYFFDYCLNFKGITGNSVGQRGVTF